MFLKPILKVPCISQYDIYCIFMIFVYMIAYHHYYYLFIYLFPRSQIDTVTDNKFLRLNQKLVFFSTEIEKRRAEINKGYRPPSISSLSFIEFRCRLLPDSTRESDILESKLEINRVDNRASIFFSFFLFPPPRYLDIEKLSFHVNCRAVLVVCRGRVPAHIVLSRLGRIAFYQPAEVLCRNLASPSLCIIPLV